ncbi:DUF1684 domain-containing protein [Rhodocytophaga rosea]|uniref:DUF1684 domain-containing protein n=1 Tax=Rhodocytophaga rosea TaxID=2704465 RepID=A0A6C0GGQ0_9BACT|nr:DUF1684 domain-containing protein [Rhodocytophaga rosea]QHT67004.1 DUF1684 domain-containing protein [Rhodocytophaga rosea]
MKRILAAIFIFIICIGTFSYAQDNTLAYQQQVEADRKKKNTEFKTGEKSPLPQKERRKFKGLHYFPVDSTYRVEAVFVRDSTQAPFKMKTTTARLPEYVKYGELHFTLHGKPFMLTVFQNLELVKKPEYKDYLFIPFTDETNGFDSYGGGRYIDFRIPATEKVILDFNQAYNPYCAYSPTYSCPIPPAENQLQVQIHAGEKSYHE